MPNSLRNQISKLRYKGKITQEECDVLLAKLDGHDAEIRADERKKVFEEIEEALNEYLFDSPMMNPIMTRSEILLFLEQLKEQK